MRPAPLNGAHCARFDPVRARMRRHAWRRARGDTCCTPSSRITPFSSVTSRSTFGVRPHRARRSIVSLAGQTISVQANELGRWHATLPALAGGRPSRAVGAHAVRAGPDRRRCIDRGCVAVRRAVEHGPASASRAGHASRDRELGERQDSPADGAGCQQRPPSANVLAGRAVARGWAVDCARSSPRRVSTLRASCRRRSTFRWV